MAENTQLTFLELAAAPEWYDRQIFFNSVRPTLFAGEMNQGQVDGMNAILTRWEADPTTRDHRHLAYALATTKHETASTMLPIEEYGKGSGREYGKKDPETGQTYYGRGFVQLTWRDNYKKADKELGFSGDDSCEWHADNALKPLVAADIMFIGMNEGWFRGDSKGRQTTARYFDNDTDDPYTAREIINGDKTKVPTWSGGKSIGNLIKDYHEKFLKALKASFKGYPEVPVEPEPTPKPEEDKIVSVIITVPAGVRVDVRIVNE